MVRLCVVPVQKLIIPWQETQVSNTVTAYILLVVVMSAGGKRLQLFLWVKPS